MTQSNGIQGHGNVELALMQLEHEQARQSRDRREQLLERQLHAKSEQAAYKYDASMKAIEISTTKAALGMAGSLFGQIGGIVSGVGTIVTDFTQGLKQAKLERASIQAEMRADKLGHEVAAQENQIEAARREAAQIAEHQRTIEDRLADVSRLA